MSWQSYVDDHLMCELTHGGQLKSAAIVGHDGGVWASSADFPSISEAQATKIGNAFEEPVGSLEIGAQKFLLLQGEPGAVIRGRQGKIGVCIKKTVTSFVFGLYEEPVPAGDCNTVVEGLGDYLISTGY